MEDQHAYDAVPWETECFSEQRRVPDGDPVFRLRGKIAWADFQQLL